MLKFSFKANFC